MTCFDSCDVVSFALTGLKMHYECIQVSQKLEKNVAFILLYHVNNLFLFLLEGITRRRNVENQNSSKKANETVINNCFINSIRMYIAKGI